MKNNICFIFIGILVISCINPVPRSPISSKTGTLMEQSVSLNKSIIKSEEQAILQVIQLDSMSSYEVSPNGFWYKFNLKSNNIYFPAMDDKVIYTYEVFDIYNSKIYGKEEIGLREYVIDKQEIVEGLRDGLKIMNEGDNVTFLFPSYKMFGYVGDHNKIDINQPLIYKVQLIKINKKNESN
ncbi:gliding motility-associated peptidyl-prolyl isomerase GldI [Lutibacter sp.]|uniref:gliding motility-associated peptidyl-prolyl isomerase GldI n=1 Tax=Lutibacter sp. TaxID=1925666 RepID=UPI001A26E6A5|nr:gliding motility-associated peptidyl-prolyl isomerase GldI [Lutibacter sp.]MBI9041155.1 gliding motility-associated peptidyl-prolyl isomerase GldI [Lutibacter sp.]